MLEIPDTNRKSGHNKDLDGPISAVVNDEELLLASSVPHTTRIYLIIYGY